MYEDLRDKANDPGLDHLKEKSLKYDHSLILTGELAELKSVIDSPSLDHIKEKAEKREHIVISRPEFIDLESKANESIKNRADKLSLKLIGAKDLEELQKVASESIEDKAAKVQMKIIPIDEFKNLEKSAIEPLTLKAEAANLKLLTLEEYQKLESPSLDYILEKANLRGFSIIDSKELDELRKSMEEPLELKAASRKQRIISISEFDKLQGNIANPSLEYLMEKAYSQRHRIVEAEKYDSLKSVANRSLEEHAKESDKKIICPEEYNDLLVRANKPSIESIKNNALLNGLTVLSIEEYEQLLSVANQPFDEKVKSLGLVAIDKAEYENLKSQMNKPTPEFLSAKARECGLHIMPIEEFESIEKAIDDKLRDVSDAEIIEMAENRGYRVSSGEISIEKAAPVPDLYSGISRSDLTGDFDADELTKKAANIDMVVISKQEYEELSNPRLCEQRLRDQAKELSLTLVPEVDILKMKQSIAEKDFQIFNLGRNSESDFSKEALINKLSEIDMVLLEKKDYHELKSLANIGKNPPPINLSVAELTSVASELGLSVITEDDFAKYEKLSRVVEDKDKLTEVGRKLGLLCVPKSAFVATTVSRTADVNKVTVIPTTYYNKLTRNDSLCIEKVSDETFKKYAEKRGYTHTDTLQAVPKSNSGSPEMNLVSKFSQPPPGGNIKSPPSFGSTGSYHKQMNTLTASNSIRSNLSHYSNVNSISDSLHTTGVLSMATNVSLTDKSMIPAITQVVIGEYLFKYYRRLGPLSSISESRHERYFWVHPYSLTLYWSSSNPVLTNPAELKTRAAAIIGVQSVEDNNPLPTGLYHKSIIVHSQNRSIKITCATRQRHNIWYNALRYLINRNVDDLTFDNDHFEEGDKSGNNKDGLYDIGDRHALPRPRISSTPPNILRSPSSGKIGRFHSLRN